MTPHNEASKGDIAKIVLMPGDPLRAKFIADNFLEQVKIFNTVRNMLGYTGYYQGKRVSIMGSGMGMPSIGIYSYELYSMYDVDAIIRIGSAGSYHQSLKTLDVVLVDAAYSESNYALIQNGYKEHYTYPSKELNALLQASADDLKIDLKKSIIHSSDVFYQEDKSPYWEKLVKEHDCKAVEMESFALFHNAKVLNKQAACLLTISDSFVEDSCTSSKERETCFTDMMKVALNCACKLDE